MTKSVNGGLYLLQSFGANYDVKQMFGLYYIYHATDGFIAKVSSQRKVRNEVRHHAVYGKIAKFYEGRE